jgi:pimeloyl-ACP methyl ester carboxylesterase
LAGGARKRRSTFDSYEDALANYASKPPMSAFHPDAREQYVRHGFKKTDNGVELKCLPEHEAVTYETGGTSGAWEQLGNIQTRTWVISGALAPFQPSSFAEAVSQQMTSSTFIRWDEVGHFGPLERPDLIVSYVASVLATLSS